MHLSPGDTCSTRGKYCPRVFLWGRGDISKNVLTDKPRGSLNRFCSNFGQNGWGLTQAGGHLRGCYRIWRCLANGSRVVSRCSINSVTAVNLSSYIPSSLLDVVVDQSPHSKAPRIRALPPTISNVYFLKGETPAPCVLP